MEDRPIRLFFRGLCVAAAFVICLMPHGCAQKDASRDPMVRVRPSLSLPDLRLRGNKPVTAAYYKKDYAFTEDWFTQEIPVWEEVLGPARGKPGLRYLEIGVFEGRALFWMLDSILTGPECTALAIDPFTGDYADRYFDNLRKSGAENRVTTLRGYSQIELRKQPLESFDFIYVDGSHNVDDVLEDSVLCLRLLRRGGIMIFDDYKWTGWNKVEPPENVPRTAIDIFYAVYGRQFEVLHSSYQVMLRKK
jgi:hypothetical protein